MKKIKGNDPYEGTALVKEVHGRLVADMENIARDANILPHWIYTPLADSGVTNAEIEWVRRFKFHDDAGLVMTGRHPDLMPEIRMAAMAGALTRNFIRARVMTITTFIEQVGDNDVPDMTCLLIPNFYGDKGAGAPMPSWKSALIYDGLLQRQSLGYKTVVYVPDLAVLGKDLGSTLEKHLATAYQQVDII